MTPRPHPSAHPHGEIREVLPGIYFVTGTLKMGPGIRFSRNMVIVREADRLIAINSIRLGDAGLAQLEGLGKLTDVIRLAGFHGMDDPFYKERYGAKIWAIKGQPYIAGFDIHKGKPYFSADVEIDATTELPIAGAKIHIFGSTPPEAVLLLARHGGALVAGDSLQNWGRVDPYFSFLGGIMMRAMGFIRTYNVGPGWLKQAKPPANDLRGLLGLEFDHLLPAHGEAVLGGAAACYRPSIEWAAKRCS